jgi:hypothetical protein
MRTNKTAAPAQPTAPAVAAPRGSRLPVAALLAALGAAGDKGATVPALAAHLAVPERDVRLAIDSARAKKHPIKRVEKMTFALRA